VTPLELLAPVGRRRIDDFYDNWTGSTKLGANLTENFAVNYVARYTDATLRFTGDDFNIFPAAPAASQSKQPCKSFLHAVKGVFGVRWTLYELFRRQLHGPSES